MNIFALMKSVARLLVLIVVTGTLLSCGSGSHSNDAGSPPPAVTDVSASAANGFITISWSPVPRADSYNIYWSTTAGVTKVNGTRISSSTSPYFHYTGSTGNTYYYVVTAVNSAGESDESLQVSATPLTPLAGNLYSPCAVAIDSANVYYTQWGTAQDVTGANFTGTVNKIGKNGGTVTTLAANLRRPGNIAVDSTDVYWTELLYNIGTISKVGINGGAVVSIATATVPGSIAVDSSSVYWMDSDYGLNEKCEIKKVGKNGGTVTVLFSGSIYDCGDFAMDHSNIYWTATDTVTGTWAIKKISVNGGADMILASGSGTAGSLTVDSTSVYWMVSTNSLQYVLMKADINGGQQSTLAEDLGFPTAMTTDSENVYWAGGETINKIGKNGGAVSSLASEDLAWTLYSLAVDSTSVYWASPATVGGAVLKVGK